MDSGLCRSPAGAVGLRSLPASGDDALISAVDETRTTLPEWWLRDLKRPITLLVAAAALLVAGAVTMVASCNVHEISHALVGTAVGWDVDRVLLCPGGATVEYARTTDVWYADPLESFAGGFGAALVLVAVYRLVFIRRDRPLRGPAWWAAGLVVLASTGAQLVIGIAEGVISGIQNRNYSQVLDDNLIITLSVLGTAMFVFAALHVWRWRVLWGSPSADEAEKIANFPGGARWTRAGHASAKDDGKPDNPDPSE
jgi:hypothetical protein